MKLIGAHVSASGGVENAPLNARKTGAGAFAFFLKNQRRWVSKPLSTKNIDEFKKNREETGYKPETILPHDGYLINLGHPDKNALKKSRDAFLDETRRCEQLGLTMLNFHPGSHLNQISPRACLERIGKSINLTLDKTENVTAVIENTAGQGSNLGFEFEQLAEIINLVEDKSRIGVCLDTCHMFAAGYDLRTKQSCTASFENFDRTVGFTYLKAMHLNDSKRDLGDRVDRHENLGKGKLGLSVFRYIMGDKRFEDIPMILETKDSELWPEEIKLLHSFIQ